MKKSIILFILLFLINILFSQSVNIKDSDEFSLMKVNDEGATGSISLQPGAPPSAPGSKLYNEGGTLKWNGTTLAIGSSLWTLNIGDVYRSTGKVGVGTSTPQGKLDIVSTDGALIVPRMTTTQRDNLPSVNGSIIYNTSTDKFNFRESGSWVEYQL